MLTEQNPNGYGDGGRYQKDGTCVDDGHMMAHTWSVRSIFHLIDFAVTPKGLD